LALDGLVVARALLRNVRVTRRSLLVLTDAWHPGWRATVDGREQPVYRVNYLFRGVFLEPGTHTILLSYGPPYLSRTAPVAAATAALLCLMLLWPLARRATSATYRLRSIDRPSSGSR
jgi:uncharacterized membrane protein YfhO